ncbi:two-component sensor histidine kinase [Shouchella clausii]|nr:two-component sensor histidine kinase [Shouchella clausii]
MKVRKRLFLTLVVYIGITMLLSLLVTQVTLNTMLNHFIDDAHAEKGDQIKAAITEAYLEFDGDWVEMNDQLLVPAPYSIAVVSDSGERYYSQGEETIETLKHLGMSVTLDLPHTAEGATVYFIDDSIQILTILQYAYRDNMTIALVASSVIVTIICTVIAYFVSKTLTAPLESLIPVLTKIGQGQFSRRVPSYSTDEYNKISHTVNKMSEQLELAEENRKQLTADIAHELRTPLTIIRGKLESFQLGQAEIPVYELLPLQDDVARLQSIIDDLQVLSLAQSDQLPLSLKRVNVASVVENVCSHLKYEADKKKQQLSMSLPEEFVFLTVDEQRMTQVLHNLMTNAIRYTPEYGEITVELLEEDSKIVINVKDTGQGIDSAALPFIFDRFYRTEKARDRNSGGSGLGLAIAKEFVQILGGTIDVKSTMGKGTTFTVILPKQ